MSDALPLSPLWQPQGETTGFPSPAQLWRERTLSLDDLLLFRPEATYFVRMRGRAMQRAGIFDQDLLVVDRSVPARSGNLIIAQVGAKFLVRRLYLEGTRTRLLSAHPSYPPIEVGKESSFAVWGVVLYVLRATSPWSKQRLKETPFSPSDEKARDV